MGLIVYGMQQDTTKPIYFDYLDILRFFLSLFVVVYHVPNISASVGLPFYNDLAMLTKGKEAVYWFFVLSGFLLSYLAKIEIGKGSFSIRKFIQRRILRIWPLYFIVSFIGIALYYFLLPLLGIPFENHASLSTTIVLTLFFLSNILHAYYDPGGILTITWSVSVEEQFYLLFPFMVVCCFHHTLFRRLTLLVLLCALLLGYVMDASWTAQLEKLGLYLELFLIGILASELVPFFKQLKKPVRSILLVAAIGLFLLIFFTQLLASDTPLYVWRCLNGCVAAFVVLVLSVQQQPRTNRWLLMGGKISYGIYMYHMIVITGIVFACKKMGLLFSGSQATLFILLLNLVVIFVTYMVAYFSYRYIEYPLLKKKQY